MRITKDHIATLRPIFNWEEYSWSDTGCMGGHLLDQFEVYYFESTSHHILLVRDHSPEWTRPARLWKAVAK